MLAMEDSISEIAATSEESIDGASNRIEAALKQITELERRIRELEGRLEAAKRLQNDEERRSEAWRGSDKSLGSRAGTISTVSWFNERIDAQKFPGDATI
jgi:transcription elongation GreA/GreB family factor